MPLILIILISGMLFSLFPAKSKEAFEYITLPCQIIRLSIENYKRTGDWTPIVLTLSDLELFLWLDKDGKVYERKEDKNYLLPPVFVVKLNSMQLLFETQSFQCIVYEQNPVRTRIKLIENNIPVHFEINNSLRKVKIYINENELKLNRLRGEIKTKGPGIKELKLTGLAVNTYSGFFPKSEIEENFYSPCAQDNQKIYPRVSRAIPSREREALVALYNSTNGDNWTNNSGWKDPPLAPDGFAAVGSENNWYGISCNQNNSTVKKITLPDNNLEGAIPFRLGSLSNLEYLNLSGNLLSGNIPGELGSLTNLGSLFLNSNRLRGSIPVRLGNLGRLSNLFLDSNQLSGSIPVFLGNLANLRSLRLNANQFSGTIPRELGSLAGLLYLHLAGNELRGNIPPQLGNLTNLVSLTLNSNLLSGEIPPQLGNLANLAFLCLDSNDLTGSIPPELRNLQNLLLLQLQDDRLGGPLPPELGDLGNLQYLYLNSNRLKDFIPGSFSNLKALIDADISYNALFTYSDRLREFLNSKSPDWESTQTIAPANLTAYPISNTAIFLTWDPIAYTGDTGHYRVYKTLTSGGPRPLYKLSEDKTTSQMTVDGLKKNSTYYFLIKTRTEPHAHNKNPVVSEVGSEVSVKTKNTENLVISGSIKDPEDKGIGGVTLIFSNFGGSCKTNNSGAYSQKIISGWSGIAKPGKKGYFFSPASRTYSNIKANEDGQDYIAIFKMIRAFQVERRQEGAWIVRRDYARINMSTAYADFAAKFALSRKQQEGEYHLQHEFFPADLQEGNYFYIDKYIEKGVLYTYKVEALDTAGTVIATSDERTI